MKNAETKSEKRKRIESYEYLSKKLRYNEHTGELFWIAGNLTGFRAGTVTIKRKYQDSIIRLNIERMQFKAHRLCWILHNKRSIPDGMVIDHIDGNSINNAFNNIRICSSRQNSCNTKIPSNNKTGAKGVSKHGRGFRAYIVKDNKQIHLGMFDTIVEAKEAYNSAARDTFGEFARLNG